MASFKAARKPISSKLLSSLYPTSALFLFLSPVLLTGSCSCSPSLLCSSSSPSRSEVCECSHTQTLRSLIHSCYSLLSIRRWLSLISLTLFPALGTELFCRRLLLLLLLLLLLFVVHERSRSKNLNQDQGRNNDRTPFDGKPTKRRTGRQAPVVKFW